MDVLSFSTAEASDAALRLHLAAARAVRFCLALQASTACREAKQLVERKREFFVASVLHAASYAVSPKKPGLCDAIARPQTNGAQQHRSALSRWPRRNQSSPAQP